MEDVKIWTRTGQTEELGAYICVVATCYLYLIINMQRSRMLGAEGQVDKSKHA